MAPQQMSELVHSPGSTEVPDKSIADDQQAPGKSIADDQLSQGEEVHGHQKELIDDGWEFFDKKEWSM